MNLLDVRKQFVKLSGHYDLITNTANWADNGADFYIRAGVDFLDRRSNTAQKQSRIYIPFSAGDWYATIQHCRSIQEVWCMTTSAKIRLEKKELTWMHLNYPGLINTAERGVPLYYTPTINRIQDDTYKDSLGEFFNYSTSDDETYRGILILSPPNVNIVLEIFGVFYSKELQVGSDDNYWTLNHPNLLVLASLYQLEILYHRNQQGANDYLIQIEHLLSDIDKDTVSEEIQDVFQLEG